MEKSQFFDVYVNNYDVNNREKTIKNLVNLLWLIDIAMV